MKNSTVTFWFYLVTCCGLWSIECSVLSPLMVNRINKLPFSFAVPTCFYYSDPISPHIYIAYVDSDFVAKILAEIYGFSVNWSKHSH